MKKKPQKFLIINPFGIGDVLFSTPLIRNIKNSYPLSKIFYLCNRRAEPIIRNNPLVDKTFIYERDEFEEIKQKSKFKWLKKFFGFLAEIKKERIDIVFDLSLNSQFGFFSWASGIKKRLGFDYKKRGRLLTHKIPMEGFKDKHVIKYYLSLLKFISIPASSLSMELFINQEDRLRAQTFLREKGVNPKEKYICVSPGGGESFGSQAYRKIWPLDNFSELCRLIEQRLKVKILIILGPKEVGLGEAFKESDKIKVISGLSIMQTAAVIEKGFLFISSDNGLLRIANALDRNIITVFGPVDEKVYSPFPYDSKKHKVVTKDIPCRPCYKKFRLPDCPYGVKCLNGISAEEVFAQVSSSQDPD
ncbi:MAG: glycosyltransferase family 9 protein [Candidatus Omnitrophica bacterium]|nr:glycosyltransferase family 9 protein [Candidatus Omnitrophota bacterium]MDD5429433.1 glycosyltransferase family 9 protein [Candidatus Omnitrophota bacterium]